MNEQMIEALRQVIDPELGINVVDLGLIYGAELEDGQARVSMTMTTPGCPIVDEIQDIREIVVKTLDPMVGSPQGVAGSTILGDGRVILILDPRGLMDIPPFVTEH